MRRNFRIVLIIFALFINGACTKEDKITKEYKPDNILTHFNKADFTRIEEFVSRFESGKTDYLLVIPPIIDGGYWIYDLRTDGKQVTIKVDSSRDAIEKVSTVLCDGISIIHENDVKGTSKDVLQANSCKESSNKIDQYRLFVLEDPMNL